MTNVDKWWPFPNLFTKERLPWWICSAISLYYMILFERGDAEGGKYFFQGFCVTGIDPNTHLCTSGAGNSHHFAWGIDVCFAIVALSVPFLHKLPRSYFPCDLPATPPSAILYVMSIVIAAVIFLHGGLHWLFSKEDCNMSDPTLSTVVNVAITPTIPPSMMYATYIFILMIVDLIGYSCIPSIGTRKMGIALSLALAAVLTMITVKATGSTEPSISAFFMISHLVVSFTGLLIPNEKTVTPALGWTFIAPCLVSYVEFAHCDELVLFGGHSWYDFFLHLSMVVSLLYGEYDKLLSSKEAVPK